MGRKAREWKEEDFEPGKVVWLPRPGSPFPQVPPADAVNPLFMAALDAIVSLDQADDESADPDWAVDVMERLYFYLGQADRSMLLGEIQKLIDYGRKAKWPSKLITMLKKEHKHFSEDE